MASIACDPNGRKRILFTGSDGKRRAVRLGRASAKQAESVRAKVEHLVSAQITGHTPDDEASRWLAALDDVMHGRLQRAGLTQARHRTRSPLGEFLDRYIADRTDAKPRTVVNMKQAGKDLVAFLGATRAIQDVTEADGDAFGRYLLRRGLAVNTARRTCGRAKQFFRFAVRKRMIQVNPFDGLKCNVQGNPAREYFVTREQADRVLAACDDPQWRALFALSRYGGLRCPSEHLALRWADVDWERSRLRVPSPKTEHHEGKDCRYLPLFPELRQHLLDAQRHAKPGAEHVITIRRDANVNLRTHLLQIIARAGLKPWPKLFHNLRASRQTELAERFPIHVVCAWLGNSVAVAKEHYLQVTDDHFAQATAATTGAGAIDVARAARPVAAAQKEAQQAAEPPRTPSQSARATTGQPPALPMVATTCEILQCKPVPLSGVEGAVAQPLAHLSPEQPTPVAGQQRRREPQQVGVHVLGMFHGTALRDLDGGRLHRPAQLTYRRAVLDRRNGPGKNAARLPGQLDHRRLAPVGPKAVRRPVRPAGRQLRRRRGPHRARPLADRERRAGRLPAQGGRAADRHEQQQRRRRHPDRRRREEPDRSDPPADADVEIPGPVDLPPGQARRQEADAPHRPGEPLDRQARQRFDGARA
jgi:integrase